MSSPTLDPLKVFGQTVRRLRLEKELTQLQVAERAELHVNYVSEVENGKRNISLVNILWFARALDVLPATLFGSFTASELKRLPEKGEARLHRELER